MNIPFCLVMTADPPVCAEFELCVRTFRMVHPDIPILCVGAGMKYACDRLGVVHVEYAADWTFATDHGKKRCLALREGLKLAPVALYCDCDILWTGAIPKDTFTPGPDVWLSPHLIPQAGMDKYGRFNSGFIATSSQAFLDWWPKVTKENEGRMFFEQQPLDLAPAAFRCAEFGPGFNLGYWQQAHAPAGFDSKLVVADNQLRYLGEPVICIHSHLKSMPGARGGNAITIYKPFVALILERLRSLPQYCNHIYMIEHLVSVPQRIVEFINWYQCRDSKHQAEIDEACRRNLSNPVPDDFCMIVESKDAHAAESIRSQFPMCRLVVVPQRPTFGVVFLYASKEMPGSIVCFANADCFFDESLVELKRMELDGKFLTITRYEDGKLIDCPYWSQDGYAILASEQLRKFAAPHPFGYVGTDNAMAHLMMRQGYELLNPCGRLRLHHLHRDKERRYDGMVPKPHAWVYPEEKGVSKVEVRL